MSRFNVRTQQSQESFFFPFFRVFPCVALAKTNQFERRSVLRLSIFRRYLNGFVLLASFRFLLRRFIQSSNLDQQRFDARQVFGFRVFGFS